MRWRGTNVFLRGHVRRSLRCPLTVECDCSKQECCSVVLPQEPVVRSERLVQLAGLALISRYSASRGERTGLQRSHAILLFLEAQLMSALSRLGFDFSIGAKVRIASGPCNLLVVSM